MPPMPHFLFGVRNILNGDGVVDVVQMALLIIYKVCVWLGAGWAIAYRTMCREQWLRVFFLAFIAKQNWIWKAISAT